MVTTSYRPPTCLPLIMYYNGVLKSEHPAHWVNWATKRFEMTTYQEAVEQVLNAMPSRMHNDNEEWGGWMNKAPLLSSMKGIRVKGLNHQAILDKMEAEGLLLVEHKGYYSFTRYYNGELFEMRGGVILSKTQCLNYDERKKKADARRRRRYQRMKEEQALRAALPPEICSSWMPDNYSEPGTPGKCEDCTNFGIKQCHSGGEPTCQEFGDPCESCDFCGDEERCPEAEPYLNRWGETPEEERAADEEIWESITCTKEWENG